MTDRAQPGAIKSALRNDELAQILGQLTGGYDDGWVVDPAEPTPAATRRSDIDESAFDGFDLSGVSGSSLSVDVGPGEAFAAGWLAIDTTTTVSLAPDSTQTIVAAMDVDAVYDPDTDPDRDAADRVVVDVAANVPSDHPRVELWTVETDGSGVVDTTDLRTPFGPAAMLNELVADVIDAGSVSADSGTVGTLEATGTFTDPAGISYGGAVNPVQVTEEASTFAESDVTVTNTETELSNGSVGLSSSNGIWVDDAEDGDVAGWSGETASLSNQTQTVLTESRTLEFTSSNQGFHDVTSPSIGPTTQNAEFVINTGKDTENTGDSVQILFYDDTDNLIEQMVFEDGGTFEFGFDNPIGTFNAGENIKIRVEWDFGSDQATVYKNGDNIDTVSINNVSNWDYIVWRNNTDDSGATRSAYLDNTVTSTSGDVLVEWDSGVPADLDSYDLATFQRTPDGETVTIDVEDGNGNVLFSDIGPNFDISTVDTSKNVKLRANLSRTDTSNNPTVDYLARRFNRS